MVKIIDIQIIPIESVKRSTMIQTGNRNVISMKSGLSLSICLTTIYYKKHNSSYHHSIFLNTPSHIGHSSKPAAFPPSWQSLQT